MDTIMDKPFGHLDGIFAGKATGWVRHTDSNTAQIVQIITLDGGIVAMGYANQPRTDLKESGLGFSIRLPDSVLCASGTKLAALWKQRDEVLPGSPVVVSHSDRMDFCVDGFCDSNKITGWLKDVTDPCRRYKMALLLNGTIIAESDNSGMIDQGSSSGRFVFTLPANLPSYHISHVDIIVPECETTICGFSIFTGTNGVLQFSDFPFLVSSEAEKTSKSLALKRKLAAALPPPLVTVNTPKDVSLGGEKDAETFSLLCSLGNELSRRGDSKEACEAWLTAIAVRPDGTDPHPHISLALCLYHLGQELKALDYLQKLPESLRNSPTVISCLNFFRSLYRNKSSRLIAFYLPQFYPCAENDAWWGKGFTEWHNVACARPLFEGHIQPRIPGELGYYDLRVPETVNAQFDLARKHGVDGFCYYFYWFNGRRLLEKPLDDLVNGKTGPFPFCICWANEPWTRSWDGASGELLVDQIHTEESDLKFIEGVAPYLAHPDYIREDGKAVLLVYRADKLANPMRTAAGWRKYCREQGIGDLLLCAVAAYDFTSDCTSLGFDALVQMPPHLPIEFQDEAMLASRRYLNSEGNPGARGAIFSYEQFSGVFKSLPERQDKVYCASMLAWDNSPRRGVDGTIFDGFRPELHGAWLWKNLGRNMRAHGNSLTFINAWNEWAEGSVLEPDAYWGKANLETVSRIMRVSKYAPFYTWWKNGIPTLGSKGIQVIQNLILVGHDGEQAGAEINLLHLAREFKNIHLLNLVFILLRGGPLVQAYAKLGTVHVLDQAAPPNEQLEQLAAILKTQGFAHAICNTVVTGFANRFLEAAGIRTVQLVHEMPGGINETGLWEQCWAIGNGNSPVVVASDMVGDAFCSRYWPHLEQVFVIPQGIRMNMHDGAICETREMVRHKLGIQSTTYMVLGMGFGTFRKGIDLFFQLAALVKKAMGADKVAFVWVGEVDSHLEQYLQAIIENDGLEDVIHVTGFTSDPYRYLVAADIFALTSREDPFPSVIMEAFSAGVPAVGFKGAGGFDALLNEKTGALVPYLDINAMAEAILCLHDKHFDSAYLRAFAKNNFSYSRYASELLSLFQSPIPQNIRRLYSKNADYGNCYQPKVSVLIPNFNHGRYLELRLRTVLDQTLLPYEVIILDDCSSDSSIKILERVKADATIPINIVVNASNSGNVFHQWLKGISMAKGDLIWIAEADDYCELALLENLVPKFEDESVVLAWSDSIVVDEMGCSRGEAYKIWYKDLVAGIDFDHDLELDGHDLLRNALLYYNCVPNASAAVFRKSCLPGNLSTILQFKYSGDWWFWVLIASKGKVSYTAEPFNYHRRHQQSNVHQRLKNEITFIREAIEDFCSFYALVPELIDMRVTLELMRQMERFYINFHIQSSQWLYIANNPELKDDYHKILCIFDPEQYLEDYSGTRCTSLVLELTNDTINIELIELLNWLTHFSKLSICLIGEQVTKHPIYDYCRLNGINISFFSDDLMHMLESNNDSIWCLGLGAALKAEKFPSHILQRTVIVTDDSYDELGKMNPPVKIRPLLDMLMSCKEIYSLTDNISTFARRLVHGAKRFAAILPVIPFYKLIGMRANRNKIVEIGTKEMLISWDDIVC